MTDLLQLDNVTRSFATGPNQVSAIKGVNIRILEGESVAIVGPSGSGKSTLLSILGLLDTGYQGRYLIRDTDAAGLDRQQLAQLRNRHIGWVFQNFNLISHLSVLQNVALPMRYNADINRADYEARAMALLQRVGLADKAQSKPTQLSGGQQQRVAIARALANEPSLVLADEPTGNLDSSTGGMIADLLMSLKEQGTTVLMVTHDEHMATRCDTQLRLRDGVLEDG
ncbi:ABC transporter ATP-binding protein [Idiomarina sp.]|uniref:ABC transporter ATP-binding protein n=1 Tax=Idiomarina sp. TaxID=1874361 RepID=UPI0025BF5428|nr:ABC transporter ATP-binding protein [Idiomarina sp.]NQZ03505.1 ABC transporter ATP-binding protein [Idiomarina sp.]